MRARGSILSLVGAMVVLAAVSADRAAAQDEPTPQSRAIPGITAEDPFPQGCVSCHVVLPDGMDVRLSTLVRHWSEGADSALVALAQSTAPDGLQLTGRHPALPKAALDIPADCLTCHAKSSTAAPPFARLIHRVHLTKGEAGLYLTMFQGECTFCHKLDLSSGAWSLPSATEP